MHRGRGHDTARATVAEPSGRAQERRSDPPAADGAEEARRRMVCAVSVAIFAREMDSSVRPRACTSTCCGLEVEAAAELPWPPGVAAARAPLLRGPCKRRSRPRLRGVVPFACTPSLAQKCARSHAHPHSSARAKKHTAQGAGPRRPGGAAAARKFSRRPSGLITGYRQRLLPELHRPADTPKVLASRSSALLRFLRLRPGLQ